MSSKHPQASVIWLIEARDGRQVQYSSAVCIRLKFSSENNGAGKKPPVEKNYLLTCAHSICQPSSKKDEEFGPVFRSVFGYPADVGFNASQKVELKPVVSGIEDLDRPTLSANKMNFAPRLDWVLLEILDKAKDDGSSVVNIHENNDDPVDGIEGACIGFPNGKKELVDSKTIPQSVQLRAMNSGGQDGMIYYQADRDTYPGMSGGGLFQNQRLRGIHRSSTPHSNNRSAICIRSIIKSLKSLNYNFVQGASDEKTDSKFDDSQLGELRDKVAFVVSQAGETRISLHEKKSIHDALHHYIEDAERSVIDLFEYIEEAQTLNHEKLDRLLERLIEQTDYFCKKLDSDLNENHGAKIEFEKLEYHLEQLKKIKPNVMEQIQDDQANNQIRSQFNGIRKTVLKLMTKLSENIRQIADSKSGNPIADALKQLETIREENETAHDWYKVLKKIDGVSEELVDFSYKHDVFQSLYEDLIVADENLDANLFCDHWDRIAKLVDRLIIKKESLGLEHLWKDVENDKADFERVIQNREVIKNADITRFRRRIAFNFQIYDAALKKRFEREVAVSPQLFVY